MRDVEGYIRTFFNALENRKYQDKKRSTKKGKAKQLAWDDTFAKKQKARIVAAIEEWKKNVEEYQSSLAFHKDVIKNKKKTLQSVLNPTLPTILQGGLPGLGKRR